MIIGESRRSRHYKLVNVNLIGFFFDGFTKEVVPTIVGKSSRKPSGLTLFIDSRFVRIGFLFTRNFPKSLSLELS